MHSFLLNLKKICLLIDYFEIMQSASNTIYGLLKTTSANQVHWIEENINQQ